GLADGAALRLDGHTLPLPAAAPSSGEIVLGVRPEHLRVEPGGAWRVGVDTVEMLGAERLIHGQLAGQPVTVRLDSTEPAPHAGDTLPVTLAAEHLHWFDAATQRRRAA
ncbi:MAG: TOBE domain-containing protein, partial [Ideonella sp.]|nr:TOBE domain-containing protein [Ideonella sp.]